MCALQVVQFDVNKEKDSTGDFLVHVLVKHGQCLVSTISLVVVFLYLVRFLDLWQTKHVFCQRNWHLKNLARVSCILVYHINV